MLKLMRLIGACALPLAVVLCLLFGVAQIGPQDTAYTVLRVRALFQPKAKLLLEKLNRLEALAVEIKAAKNGTDDTAVIMEKVKEAERLLREVEVLCEDLGIK